MSEQPLPLLGPGCEPDLDQHLAALLASLAQAGYAEKMQRDKARRITLFLQWMREAEIRLCEVDDIDACIDALLAHPARRRYNHRCALQAFMASLREVEVLPQHSVEPSAAAALCQDDLAHLQETAALLAAPDRSTWIGRRDHTLLLVAVQTGLRNSELRALRGRDVELNGSAYVYCMGKRAQKTLYAVAR